jgi:ABC-type dipeptide/oligopeptide/nickel transport system permease subunit
MPESVPALAAAPPQPPKRDNPLTRSKAGVVGLAFLVLMLGVCLGTLPWTLARGEGNVPRYNAGRPSAGRLPPFWVSPTQDQTRRFNRVVDPAVVDQASKMNMKSPPDGGVDATTGPIAEELHKHWPRYWLGTDVLGRSLLVRCLTGGGISLGIGLCAAFLSVIIGTVYGTVAGYAGGRLDAVMMRIVDILYGLPYILLVVLLAVASTSAIDEYVSRQKAHTRWIDEHAADVARERGLPFDDAGVKRLLAGDEKLKKDLDTQALELMPPRPLSEGTRMTLDIITLLVAIGGVSWLTMARVIRGQVLTLKNQPFVEAARAIGAGPSRIFRRHLLPNLMGPIIVYATLTVPQAILQESFLSFLGIGVKPPLPSWGNLAADGLEQLNPYQSNWWLLLFPCLLLGTTLLALNFVGEGLREAMDPKRARR